MMRHTAAVFASLVILVGSVGAEHPPDGELEFDFYYETKHPGPIPMTSVRRIRGRVPFSRTNFALSALWCPGAMSMGYGEYQAGPTSDVVGSGQVKGEESFTITYPGGYVCKGKTRYSFAIDLKGKYWWKPNDNQCSDETVNFSYTATYNEDQEGSVTCTPGTVSPLRGKTTMYQTGFDESSETLEFHYFPYMTLEVEGRTGPVYRLERWTLHLGTVRGHEESVQGVNPQRYASPPPQATETRPARFGPPLSELPILPPPAED